MEKIVVQKPKLVDLNGRERFVMMVANQMMKGPNYGRIPGTPHQQELFRQRHARQIRWVVDQLPRCSAALGAVVVKCLIKYGEHRVRAFAKALKECSFEGKNDPAYLTWMLIQKHSGKDTVSMYQKAVCGAKAHMEGRTLKKLKAAMTDIFDWDDGWSVPDDLLKGWNPDTLPGVDETVEEDQSEISGGQAASSCSSSA
jgi:hypothetical protein